MKFFLLALFCLLPALSFAGPEPDSVWRADRELSPAALATDTALGEAQGAAFIDDKIYIFGDCGATGGLLKEYDRAMHATGRQVRLTRGGQPVFRHPTGLAHDPGFGFFLGDTVNGKAHVFRLDWATAWKEGTLDHAVTAAIDDDLARNGGRPEFVTVGGKRWLATTDYNAPNATLRLYDPDKLVAAGRSSAAGVLGYQIPVAPLTQSLLWDEATGRLWHARNVTLGRGWAIDSYDLAAALAARDAHDPSAHFRRQTLPPHDELEGFIRLPQEAWLFVTSSGHHNLAWGKLRAIGERETPAGFYGVNFADSPARTMSQ